MDRKKSISYAQAMFRRAAKEEIEEFKANVIINIQQLLKTTTRVIWEINRH